MPTTTYTIKVDDSELQMSRKNLLDHTDHMIKSQDKVGKSIKESYDKASRAEKKYEKGLDDLEKKSDQAITKNREMVKQQAADYKVLGVSINDIKGKIAQWTTIQRTATGAIGGSSKALKIFKAALISTGIGAIVVALGSLVALLAKTQKGLDFVSKVMAGLGELVATVIDSLSSLGSAIVKVFKGDFAGALDDVKEAGTEIVGLGQDMKDAWNLEAESQVLRDNMLRIRKEVALSRAEIRRLNKDAEDTTKSYAERGEAAQKAFTLEQKLVEKRLKAAEQEISILERQQALGKNTFDDNESLIELIEQRSAIEQESTELQTTLQNKLNTINQQRVAQLEREAAALLKLQEKYAGFEKQLAKQLQDADLSNADPVTRLALQRDIALQTLEEQKQTMIDLANELGKPVADVEAAFKNLSDEVVKEYIKLKRELETERLDALDYRPRFNVDTGLLSQETKVTTKLVFDALTGEIKNVDKVELDQIPLTISFAEVDLTDGPKKALDDVAKAVGDLFESEEFKAAFDLGNKIADAFTSIYESQIQGLESLAAQRQERIDELRDSIELEEELQKEGSRNLIDQKKDELNTLLAQQEESNEKVNALRKKQVQIETAQALASQVASFGSAIAKVFDAHAPIPFVGVAIAAGFIATMIATIASANAQIKQLTALSGGAERFGDHYGDIAPGYQTDKVSGREDKGLRVVHRDGRDTGIRLGAEERVMTGLLNKKIGRVVQYYEENPSKATELLNWFDGMQTDDIIQTAAYNVQNIIASDSTSKDDMIDAFNQVMTQHRDEMIKYQESVPNWFFLPDEAGELFTRKDGQIRKVKTRPKRRKTG